MAEGTATLDPTPIRMPGDSMLSPVDRGERPVNLNALAPTSAPSKRVANVAANHEVGAGFVVLIQGKTYREGNVLHGWYCDLDGGLQGKVAQGALVETSKMVNVECKAPPAKTTTDPVPYIANENIRLTAEVESLAAGNRMLVAQMEDLKSRDEGRIRALAELTDQVAHWRKIAEEKEQQLKDYDALLNAPAPASTDVPTPDAKPTAKTKGK